MDNIGPYEIHRQLGSGGMGEVFLARDTRLRRMVAIKRLRLKDRGSIDDARQRFRREARLAATLNHPSIVQIYDVISEGDLECLVMEYVPGATLRQRLSEGPVPFEETRILALQIARGLHHAHQHGVIHRDLKAENILIDAKGQAKISDFGIAKSLEEDAEQTEITQGNIVGTCYAMSPEQAMGRAVDYRSDLFSLGTLLYEMVTGRSPFKGANKHETLHRIINHPPEPVEELTPHIPQDLADLIAFLLQKQPELRPRHALEVIESLHIPNHSNGLATSETLFQEKPQRPIFRQLRTLRLALALGLVLVAGAVLGALWILKPGTPASPLYVAIVGPNNEGNDHPAMVRLSTEVAITEGLLALENVFPVEVPARKGIGRPNDIARIAGTQEVVHFDFSCVPEPCQLTFRRLEGVTGSLLWMRQIPVPTGSDLLFAQAVKNTVRQAFGERPRRKKTEALTTETEDYAAYLALLHDFREENQPKTVLQAKLAELRERTPTFLYPYLLECEVLRLLFEETRDPDFIERGLALAVKAAVLAPNDPRAHLAAFDLALSADNAARARHELETLERRKPQGTTTLRMGIRLAQHLGETAKALSLSQEMVRRHPSATNYYNLGNIYFKLGNFAGARQAYADLLARDPSHLRGKRMLANVELLHGEPKHAAQLLAELAESKPSLSTLSNLGVAQMLLQRYDLATASFQKAHALSPNHVVVNLNLGDALSLAGKGEEARRYYQTLLELVEKDPAGQSYLGAKAQALAHLGETLKAVEAIQEALRRDAQNPETVYAAAVVYSLVGDRASAVLNAKRAVDAGFHARWFVFPWFDGLRGDPDFVKLMSETAPPKS